MPLIADLGSAAVHDLSRYGVQGVPLVSEIVRAGADLTWFQSNAEGDLVDAIQQLPGSADGAIINAAAYSHTSLALRDALLAVRVPFIEVHLSNIFARDEMRRHSLLADLAVAVIAGLGPRGYEVAVDGLVEHLRGG